MIDIFKGLIDLLITTLHGLFNIQIPLFNDRTAPLGMLILAVMFLVIAIVLICHVMGIDFGGDD